MWWLLLLLMLALYVSGCAATKTTFHVLNSEKNSIEKVAEIEQDSLGAASYEQDKDGNVKVSVDTRKPNWWERNIAPIFTGAVSKATDSVEYSPK